MRMPAFFQALLVLLGAFLVFDNAFPPLMPRSLMIQFMLVVLLGVLLYYSYDDERWAEFKAPLYAVAVEPHLLLVRWALLLLVPGIVGYTAHNIVRPSLDPPVELRQAHPAPPAAMRVYDKSFDLATLENPLRMEVLDLYAKTPEAAWEKYDEHVAKGREIYFQNCFHCHGDLLDGKGHFAPGLNPLPTNFQDVGTIAQLQESFLFWRVTAGGVGLPKEGAPWSSAMPAWHETLREEQVWQVLMFLYDYVGQVPRMWNPGIAKQMARMQDEVKARRAGLMGRDLYRHRCAVCHGEEGEGDGVAADFVYPKPRDFSLAVFKYKTTPGKKLPSDEDLFRITKYGLHGTSMPGWGTLLSDAQIRSLIPVMKSFDISGNWAPADADDEDFDDDGRYLKDDFRVFTASEPLEGQVPYTDESIAKGKPVYEEICAKCHGMQGRGNITSGKRLEDDWRNRLWPRDLTKPWTWRWSDDDGSDAARDAAIRSIYQRLTIGMVGTPMPASRAVDAGNPDPITLENRWHVANYVYALRAQSVAPGDEHVIRAAKVEGPLPGSVTSDIWETAPPVTLRLVPNIIKGERLFAPLNDAVTVRAVFNKNDIAFLLEINDRTDSRPGEPVSAQIHDASLDMHADAFAIQFPKEGAFTATPVVSKPLNQHGDRQRPATIWYWNAGSVEPEIAPQAVVIDGEGPDRDLKRRAGDDSLKARGQWEHGRWRVIMRHARQGAEAGGVNFSDGRFIPVAFANWDGNNGETGARHTLTGWYWVAMPQEVDSFKVYGMPLGLALLTFWAGIVLVRRVRRG